MRDFLRLFLACWRAWRRPARIEPGPWDNDDAERLALFLRTRTGARLIAQLSKLLTDTAINATGHMDPARLAHEAGRCHGMRLQQGFIEALCQTKPEPDPTPEGEGEQIHDLLAP